MTGAIAAAFAAARKERRAALIPFLAAGDPDLRATERFLRAARDGGADLIELGVPWSDPVADGPVIQRAAARALAAGTNLAGVLGLVARVRPTLGVPLVLFSYFNPIHAMGLERFAAQASAAGLDGVLCVDLPPEEAGGLRDLLDGRGIDLVCLLAPTSSAERIETAGRVSRGFVYYVSRAGTTGERAGLEAHLHADLRRLRRRIALPVAVGFGISTPGQVASVAPVADGVVVGSALVRLLEEAAGEGIEAGARRLESRLRTLRRGSKVMRRPND